MASDLTRFKHFPGLSCVAVLLLGLLYPAAIVHCQSNPPNSSKCRDRELAITADSRFSLYVDGTEVVGLKYAHNSTVSDTVPIVSSTRLLAVQVDIFEILGGVLASLDRNDVLTDGSWKCTNDFYPDWMTLNFSDSTWPNAHVLCRNGFGHWGYISGISHSANWITAPGSMVCIDGTVPNVTYCRKPLGVCRPPCNNGSSGPRCIDDCTNLPDGDYQSCQGCHVYIVCSKQKTKMRKCSPKHLVWDDYAKRCKTTSTTCQCPHEDEIMFKKGVDT